MTRKPTPTAAFRAVMREEGFTAAVTDRLLQLAARHQLVCLIRLNEPAGHKFEQEERELEKALRALCQREGAGIIAALDLNGDARGASVKVRFTSGRDGNSFGDPRFYCVPVPTYTAEHARQAAHLEPMSWTEEPKRGSTRFVVVFMANTCSYRAHAESCNAATDNENLNRHRCAPTFDTLEAARNWADRDEWEKGDRNTPVKGSARFKVCPCARAPRGGVPT